MIPSEVINDILAKADIVDVIERYIPVIKHGNSFKAVCPFHNDSNPSLNISRSKQIFKCFACNTGGNVFGFVSRYEHITFEESVKKVADIISYSSPLLEQNSTFKKQNQELYNCLNDAKDFYHYALKTNIGLKAKEYLLKRNISEEMQDYFSLGYAPNTSNIIIKTLEGKNHNLLTLDKVGITMREASNIVDRFQNRVMFPIYNVYDDVIGFSGRLFDQEGPKYLNTPATEVFNKSAVLYNLNNAKKESKSSNYVYIVEGFMDVFALYKVGIKSSIALMGTAFTKTHATILRRLGVEIRIMLDGDNPGQDGILKMIPILEKEGLHFKIVDYQDVVLDPDEILNQMGKDKLLEIATRLISPTDFIINKQAKIYNLRSLEDKKNFVLNLANRINLYETKLEKEEFLKKIALKANVSYDAVVDIIRRNIQENSIKKDKIVKEKSYSVKTHNGIENAEKEIIFQMINNKDAIQEFLKDGNNHFDDDVYGLLYNYILDAYENNVEINPSSLINALTSQNADSHVLDMLINISMENNHFAYDPVAINEMIKILNERLLKKQSSIVRKNDAINSYEKMINERKN